MDFAFNARDYFAQYSGFSLAAEADNFRLSLDSYTNGSVPKDDLWAGRDADGSGTSGKVTVNGVEFSTPDRDNDNYGFDNCASQRHGGWWYNHCTETNLNGVWRSKSRRGMWWVSVTGYDSVTWTELKVRVTPGVDWSLLDTRSLDTSGRSPVCCVGCFVTSCKPVTAGHTQPQHLR